MQESTQKIFLIRHAQTEYNILNQQALEQNLGKAHFKHVPDLVDCDISSNGYNQAQEAAKKVEELDIDLVLVSPMRRALRTASLIFENHPKKPKLLALPMIREIFASSCDIPKEFSKVKEEFPHVDFTLIEALPNPRLWFLDTIQDENIKKEIGEGVSENPDTVDYVKIMLDRFSVDKTGNETRLGVRLRADKIKKILSEDYHEYKNLALVSHYSILKVLTASNFNERDRGVDGLKFENAQVCEWHL
jgi:Histidine phosphatase superfamily (branch 1)